ncbi:hypothetical protein ACLBXO_24380 [Methylobacterium sp. C33D]
MRCHGLYPNVADMVTVAFRNANVFVSPDMDTFAPGGGLHDEAANGFMKDQFLFGASFPFCPLGQGVADFRGLGLSGGPWRPPSGATPTGSSGPASARREGPASKGPAPFAGAARRSGRRSDTPPEG